VSAVASGGGGNSPARSLARRFAGSLRFRLRQSYGGTSPKRLRREGGRVARLAALARDSL